MFGSEEDQLDDQREHGKDCFAVARCYFGQRLIGESRASKSVAKHQSQQTEVLECSFKLIGQLKTSKKLRRCLLLLQLGDDVDQKLAGAEICKRDGLLDSESEDVGHPAKDGSLAASTAPACHCRCETENKLRTRTKVRD